MSGQQLTLAIWETEVVPAGENRAVVTARKPLHRLNVEQAAKILGCPKDTIYLIYRAGLITGWKPGARSNRSDGRASNAALVLDAESVLRYKESVTSRGVF